VVLYHQPSHGVFNTLENQIPELELAPHLKVNSFGYRQGMLQVHADFCRNFFQGCADCELIELLQAQAG